MARQCAGQLVVTQFSSDPVNEQATPSAAQNSATKDGRHRANLIVIFGAAELGALLLLFRTRDLSSQPVRLVVWFGLAWLCYAAGVWVVADDSAVLAPRRLFVTLIVVGVVARLLALAAAPTLSTDLYRYVWEGEILRHGFSPYAFPPDAPVLAPLRDAVWAHVNNPSVPSPYPPLAVAVSLVESVLFPHSTFGPKLFATIFDVASALLLFALLKATGRPPRRVLISAWNPLVIEAFPLSGHNDSLMIALLLGALLVGRHSSWTGGLLFGLAALAKVVPLLALPFVWRRWGSGAAVLAGGLFVAAYLPFLAIGHGYGSLPRYLTTFADNDSLHALLRAAAEGLALPFAEQATRVATVAIFVVVAALLLRSRRERRPLWWQVYAIFALALLLAPSVHAWYSTWLLPFIVMQLRSSRRVPFFQPSPTAGWLLFSGLVVLPYVTYRNHEWQLWISAVEYVPLYLLLAAPLLSRCWPSARVDAERETGLWC